MYFKVSWDQDFQDLMMFLWGKYGREVFTQNGIGDQLDLNKFSKDFFNNNTTTADVSIDDNSNIANKNIIDYNFEFSKPLQRYNSHYLLWKQLRQSYGLLEANEIIEKQISGEIYINDFTNCAIPYCFNYSTYDIALEGLTMAGRMSIRSPKSLESFIRQLEQFTVYAANSTLGATGLADVLIVASYYVDKIIKNGYDGHVCIEHNINTESKFTDKIKIYVSERLRSFIFTLNWQFRGNQCVTEDTDVLTPSGWKTLDELSINDDIYTWKDGVMNINTVDAINIYDYDGELHRYEGRDVIQEVSPEHRIVYKTGTNAWKIKQSKSLIDSKSPIYFPVTAENYDNDYDISDDLLKFITFILTDGSIDIQHEKLTRIKWCKSHNRWGINEFKTVCDVLGFNYNQTTQRSEFGDVEVFTLPNQEISHVLDMMNYTKAVLPEFLTKLSKKQSQLVLGLWSKLDGYEERFRLQCDNTDIADMVQHIAFRAGYGSRQHSRLIGNNRTETLYVKIYKASSKMASKKEKFHYKGRIWCPTTEDGVVIFRKNGKVFVSGNSPFTNISVYDDYFLKELIKDYIFTDGKVPNINTVKNVQEIFITAMNDELERSTLTFPVTTACFYVKDGEIQDLSFLDYIAEQNLKFGFINMYYGDSSTLSSCCRLRSDRSSEYFNTFGAGSTKIGSLGVVTQNFPRLAYMSIKTEDPINTFKDLIKNSVTTVAKINNCKRNIIKKRIDLGAMPLYTLGHMDLSKQYSTYGVNGLNEALEVLGFDITEQDGENFVIEILDIINRENDKMTSRFKNPHNVEQTPSESSACKLAKRDEYLKYQDQYKLYSNQFIPLITNANVLDRLRLQGKFDSHFSGGAIAHINLEERVKDKESLKELMIYAAKCGVIYWAVNYAIHRCIDNHCFVDGKTCPVCGKPIETTVSRVVGFFTNIANWNETRREHDWKNRQFYNTNDIKIG